MAQVIPNAITPLTPEDAAEALAGAYKSVTGDGASKEILGLLIGQTALETANWQSIHNYNLGNVKGKDSDDYIQFFRCFEVVRNPDTGEKETVWYDPPHPACRFVAYRNAQDGAEHYIKMLRSRPHWWKGLHSGSVDGFVNGLTTFPAYFTANPAVYNKVLADRMALYKDAADKYSDSTSGLVGTALAILGGIGAGFGVYKAARYFQK